MNQTYDLKGNNNKVINSSGMLSIHDLCRQGTTVLGPGIRYVVWTQGCPFKCEGCVTPNSRPITKDKLIGVADLAGDILSQPRIEGITISGGEPFLQAAALADLLEIVLHVRPELTVISYTGYTREALSWPDAQRLINHLDLLIDGPYIQTLNDNRGIRGSSNQRLHFLTDRLQPWKEEMEHGKRTVEYHVRNGNIKAYGVPADDMNI